MGSRSPIRDNVYEAIDGERDYQDVRWQKPRHTHTNTEFLVYINHYVQKGLAAVSVADSDLEAKDVLRKIAALAVAAMEANGVVERSSHDLTKHIAINTRCGCGHGKHAPGSCVYRFCKCDGTPTGCPCGEVHCGFQFDARYPNLICEMPKGHAGEHYTHPQG